MIALFMSFARLLRETYLFRAPDCFISFSTFTSRKQDRFPPTESCPKLRETKFRVVVVKYTDPIIIQCIWQCLPHRWNLPLAILLAHLICAERSGFIFLEPPAASLSFCTRCSTHVARLGFAGRFGLVCSGVLQGFLGRV